MTKIINLYGGPGTGKSTTRAGAMIYHSEAVSAALRENALRAAMDAIAFWLARECDEIKGTFDVDLMRKTEKRGKT